MTPSIPRPIHLDALLAESAWLRRISGALMGGQDGEDLAQEVLRIAIQDPPALTGGRLRAWLHTVARHSASRQRWRADTRRYVEKHAASEEAHDDESSRKLLLHQRFAQAIDRLEPIYRDVLVMRYLEEQPPREIAKQLSLPASTVRKRVSRGLQKLREQLDREFEGGREAWCLALLPMVPHPPLLALPGPLEFIPHWSATASALPLAMLTKSLLAVAGLMLAYFMLMPTEEARIVMQQESSEEQATESLPPSMNAAGELAPRVWDDKKGSRRAVDTQPESSQVGDFQLQVVNESGQPLAQAKVAWSHDGSVAELLELNEQATVALPQWNGPLRIWAHAKGYASHFVALSEAQLQGPLELVLQRGRTLSGILLEEGATPEQPAPLELTRDSLGIGLTSQEKPLQTQLVNLGALARTSTTTTSPDGTFEFHGLTTNESGRVQLPSRLELVAKRGGSAGYGVSANYTAETQFLTLRSYRLPSIRGRFIWEDNGLPLHGHLNVILANRNDGGERIRADIIDSQGRFEIGFEISSLAFEHPFAERSGYMLDSQLRLSVDNADGTPISREWKYALGSLTYPVDLGDIMVERAPCVRLLVVDAQGEPVAGAAVGAWLDRQLTDAAGIVQLDVQAGDELLVIAPGYTLERLSTDQLMARGSELQRIELKPGCALSVSFTEELQAMLRSEVQIKVSWEHSPFSESDTFEAENPSPFFRALRAHLHDGASLLGQGKFSVPGLPGFLLVKAPTNRPFVLSALKPGAVLSVALADLLAGSLVTRQVSLPFSAMTTSIEIGVEDFQGLPLRVFVYDQAGAQLPATHAFVSSKQAGRGHRFDADKGQLNLGPFPPGTYDISVGSEGYLDQQLSGYELTPGALPVRFTLQPSRELTFRVENTLGIALPNQFLTLTDDEGFRSQAWDARQRTFHVPVHAVRVSTRIGTRMIEQWIPALDTEFTFTLPVSGALRLEVSQGSRANGDDGTVTALIKDVAGEVSMNGGFTERSAEGLSLEQVLLPGSYQVQLHFHPDGETDTPGATPPLSLFEGTVKVRAGEATRIELSVP